MSKIIPEYPQSYPKVTLNVPPGHPQSYLQGTLKVILRQGEKNHAKHEAASQAQMIED